MAQEVLYKTIFQIHRGTLEKWAENNPIPRYGEPCFGYSVEPRKYVFKIGNGVDHWNDLPDLIAQGGGGTSEDVLELIEQLKIEIFGPEEDGEHQEFGPDKALESLARAGIIIPVADEDNALFTDDDGNIYVL